MPKSFKVKVINVDDGIGFLIPEDIIEKEIIIEGGEVLVYLNK